jgi:hypothetical protein
LPAREYSVVLLIGAIIGVISIVMLLVAIESNQWFIMEDEGTFWSEGEEWTERYTVVWGLDRVDLFREMEPEDPTLEPRDNWGYDNEAEFDDNPEFIEVANSTKYMLWAGVAMMFGLTAMMFATGAGLIGRPSRFIRALLALVTFVAVGIVLVTSLDFAERFPDAASGYDWTSVLGNYEYEDQHLGSAVQLSAQSALVFIAVAFIVLAPASWQWWRPRRSTIPSSIQGSPGTIEQEPQEPPPYGVPPEESGRTNGGSGAGVERRYDE